MDNSAIWGSFERNTGAWTPYTAAECARIEAAYQSGQPDVELPTCFNAIVHFNYNGGSQDHHYQLTPAVGSKPPGFRSVLRGNIGQRVTLHWWADTRLWRLDLPAHNSQYVQEVTITPAQDSAAHPTYTWQWCDLIGEDIARAVEINWHAYTPEHGDQIEEAWSRGVSMNIVIGLTSYDIGEWQGTYGTQRNLTTGAIRQVRRGRFVVEATTPEALRDDSCALCTERFCDTPQWPIRCTPCNHWFHYTCLQHILRQTGRSNRCPMCRRSLADMSSRNSSSEDANAWHAGFHQQDVAAMYEMQR